MFINSILVNFTKLNFERILQQNEKYNLTDIISEYSEQNNINFSFYINIINYINDRKKFVEDKNRKGDIYFKESDFNCVREFDTKQSNSFKTKNIFAKYQGLEGLESLTSAKLAPLKVDYSYYSNNIGIQKEASKLKPNSTLSEELDVDFEILRKEADAKRNDYEKSFFGNIYDEKH